MERKPRIIPKESIPGDTHTAHHYELKIDVYKLIHATQECPAVNEPLSIYVPQLDQECWTDIAGKKITPRQVVEAYRSADLEEAIRTHPELEEHLRQIEAADLSHPILIFESEIIDGMHRLAKAYAEEHSEIKAKILETIPLAARMQ